MSHAQEERIAAVIFDCDGTLVDSEDLTLEAILEQAAGLGLRFGDREEAASWFRGRSMESSLRVIEARLGAPLPHDFEQALRARMAASFRASLQPVQGAREVLRQLAVPYCVATNGPRSKAELTLELTGLLPFVRDRIFCAPEIGVFKPDPGLFLAAAAALGVEPRRCAVVEDSVPGIAAGLAAGMQVYALHRAGTVRELAGSIRFIDSLEELLRTSWQRLAPPNRA